MSGKTIELPKKWLKNHRVLTLVSEGDLNKPPHGGIWRRPAVTRRHP